MVKPTLVPRPHLLEGNVHSMHCGYSTREAITSSQVVKTFPNKTQNTRFNPPPPIGQPG
jgi:hypothetical protein